MLYVKDEVVWGIEGGRVFYLPTFLNPFNRFSQGRATKGLVGDRTGAY